ncbi:hypothetical protein [Nocardia wallacei]|uniref:hypothetical protein n=1 Tax=Nocardia wallacei TaxID=480035 RepID=UPI002453DB8F|nr:hypothetical protein [Nocardia wallacei]
MTHVSCAWVAPVSAAIAGSAVYSAAMEATTSATAMQETATTQRSRADSPVTVEAMGSPKK